MKKAEKGFLRDFWGGESGNYLWSKGREIAFLRLIFGKNAIFQQSVGVKKAFQLILSIKFHLISVTFS